MATTITNLLVPVDFSSGSFQVVKFAASLVKPSHGSICLLHCVEQDVDDNDGSVRPVPIAELTEYYTDEYLHLTKMAASLEDDGFDVQLQIVRGTVADAILAIAQQNQTDLIVIGSQGHDAVWDHELGSVTEDVLIQAGLPVLVVPTSTVTSNRRCVA